MSLTILAYRFVSQPELYDFYVAKKKDIEWMVEQCGPYVATHFLDDDDPVNRMVMKGICRYIERYKKMPPSFREVRAYVSENPEFHKEYIQGDSEEGQLHKVEDLLKLLEKLEEWEPPENPRSGMEIETLFDAVFKEVHGSWLKYVHERTAKIANGELVKINRTEVSGPAAAEQWFRMEMQNDFKNETTKIKGLLKDNIKTIRELIIGGKSNQKPLTTGYSFIDKVLVQKDRFIGILGKSGRGKTTLLYNIIYHELLNGKNILLNSMEDDPETVYRKIAYLHSQHTDYRDIILPPWKDFENGLATEEQKAHLEKIIRDIEMGENILGTLDVQDSRDWEEMRDYAQANKTQFDIWAIDYLAHIASPPSLRFGEKNNYINEIIDEVQGLCRTFYEGRGITIISPIQVNREGMKAAVAKREQEKKKEERNQSVSKGTSHYSLENVHQHTNFIHDLDLCLTVFSDDEMFLSNKIELGCTKHRQGQMFQAEILNVDSSTGVIQESGWVEKLVNFNMDNYENLPDGIDDIF